MVRYVKAIAIVISKVKNWKILKSSQHFIAAILSKHLNFQGCLYINFVFKQSYIVLVLALV